MLFGRPRADFAAIGYEHSGFDASSSDLLGSGFSVRYDAAASAYVIDLPSTPAGRFGASSQDASYWHGLLSDPAGPEPSMNILKPANPNLSFVYTTFGDYYEYEFGGPVFDGFLAFGQATPAGSVPIAGSATYSALLSGNTLDWTGRIGGTATLQFNFALGTLAGWISPILMSGTSPTSLGQYNFVNTVYGVGSPTFSGGLQHSTSNLTGSFNGLFTGPAAQELMARWIAQYSDPSGAGTKEMYGVLVGKKP